MRILIRNLDIQFGVTLYQTSKNFFAVLYGKQLKEKLTYEEAATEFGLCIMHALTCEGKIQE